MARLTLEYTPQGSFELPDGATQVGTFAVTAQGGICMIFDPAFVKIFNETQLEDVIARIGDYLRVIHGQGLPQ